MNKLEDYLELDRLAHEHFSDADWRDYRNGLVRCESCLRNDYPGACTECLRKLVTRAIERR